MSARRKLLKALAASPMVVSLSAGATVARSSFCEGKSESYEIDPDTGDQGLTASCMTSIADRIDATLING